MRAVKLTLCPEDILADFAGLLNELFEAQLSEEVRETASTEWIARRLRLRLTGKRRGSRLRRSYRQCDGHDSAVINVPASRIDLLRAKQTSVAKTSTSSLACHKPPACSCGCVAVHSLSVDLKSWWGQNAPERRRRRLRTGLEKQG
jgi:hypothetical protein